METFVAQMMEVSIKQIYGWVAYACILLFLLLLLYDAPIRRELKQMPFWRSVRKEVEKELKMENGKLKMENEKKVSLQPD